MPPHLHGAHATPPPEPMLCVQAASAWRSGLHPRRPTLGSLIALALILLCLGVAFLAWSALPGPDPLRVETRR